MDKYNKPTHEQKPQVKINYGEAAEQGTKAISNALQAGAARDYALAKANKQLPKHKRVEKRPAYVPGKLGVSGIATEMKAVLGTILSRRDRKKLAKETGQKFKAFIN